MATSKVAIHQHDDTGRLTEEEEEIAFFFLAENALFYATWDNGVSQSMSDSRASVIRCSRLALLIKLNML